MKHNYEDKEQLRKKAAEEYERKQAEPIKRSEYQEALWQIDREFRELRSVIQDHLQAIEHRKLINRIKRALGLVKKKITGLTDRLYKATETFRVRQRRHFYRIHVKKAVFEAELNPSLMGLNSLARIVVCCTPTWLGRKLGYPTQLQGYYGTPREWRRMVGSSGLISSAFEKQLTAIYKRTLLDRQLQ